MNKLQDDLRDIDILDRVIRRTQPSHSWLPAIVAVFALVFMGWMSVMAVEKAAFDVVHGMEMRNE